MNGPVTMILVPGAWMGGWIWEPTVERLRAHGLPASTMTLAGLGEDDGGAAKTVRLEDHVRQVREAVTEASGGVVLVSHSYSGIVTGQVADQVPDDVVGLIHIGGFLPVDGRSMLDDWGSSQSEREQEARDVEAAGNLWLAPTDPMLEMEPDLSNADRDFLVSRFRAHPGSTISDPARMATPIAHQPTTYVSLSPDGEEAAWQQAPAPAQAARGWRRRFIASGHWPMLSRPDEVVDLLATEARRYAQTPPAPGLLGGTGREGDVPHGD